MNMSLNSTTTTTTKPPPFPSGTQPPGHNRPRGFPRSPRSPRPRGGRPRGPGPSGARGSPRAGSTSYNNNKGLAKYEKMKKAKTPTQAIMNTMIRDGIDSKRAEAFLSDKNEEEKKQEQEASGSDSNKPKRALSMSEEIAKKNKKFEMRSKLRNAPDEEIEGLTNCWACKDSRIKLSEECMCRRNWADIMGTAHEIGKPKNNKRLQVAKMALKKANKKGLLRIGRMPLLRAKLMVVGRGEAGKTCTVGTLCHKDFDTNPPSTIGVTTSLQTVLVADNMTVTTNWKGKDSEYSRALNELVRQHIMTPGADSFLQIASAGTKHKIKEETEKCQKLERELIAELPGRKEHAAMMIKAAERTHTWAKDFYDDMRKKSLSAIATIMRVRVSQEQLSWHNYVYLDMKKLLLLSFKNG